jgi:Zn finger protein HypA/HybF involved in hydrogenase expression
MTYDDEEVSDLEAGIELLTCTRCKVQPEGFTKDDVFAFKCPSCGKEAATVEEWNKLNG